MMKATELRIGNWIRNGIGEEFQVNQYTIAHFIPSQFTLGEFTPIELTEDWLLRLGFEKKDYGHTVGYDSGRWRVTLGDKDTQTAIRLAFRKDEWYPKICDCPYVHTLQNFYYAAENEELTLTQSK